MIALLGFNNKSFSTESAAITPVCEKLLSAKNNSWLPNFPQKMQRVARLLPPNAREKNTYYQKLKYLKPVSLGFQSSITTFEIEDSLKANGYLAQLGSTVELFFYFLQAQASNGSYYEAGENPTPSMFRGRELLELMQAFFLFVDDYIALHPEVDEIWVRTAEIYNIERLVPFLEAYGFELLHTKMSEQNHKKYYLLKIKKTQPLTTVEK